VSPADTARARLEALRPVYDAVRDLQGRRDELQSVAQARAACEALLAGESAARDELRRRKEELQDAVRRATDPRREEGPAPWEFNAAAHTPWQPPPRRVAPPRPPRPPIGQWVRDQLRVLVNAHQFAWKLDPGLLGRINRIADSTDRPLGEALALLPWEAFAAPGFGGESAHRTRLAEWREALEQYLAALEADVEFLEQQTEGWAGIARLWRERDRGPDEQDRWKTYLDERRRGLRDEADALRRDCAELEGRLRAAGGGP
jgi:hypothetical protein